MYRTLIHYWRIHLAVVLAAATATAVLTGALAVGDSVRGSLRDLTLERLGRIDDALTAPGFFRESLAGELASHASAVRAAAPAIVLRGSATVADAAGGSGRRASRIGILGVDERFGAMFEGAAPLALGREASQLFPPVVVNESLQRELGAAVGDALLLAFERYSSVPRETLLGEKDPDDVVGTLRVTLAAVIPDRGLGGFAAEPGRESRFNAFVSLQKLQRALEQPGRVNTLVVARSAGAESPHALLREHVTLDDLGLVLRAGAEHLDVTSRELVLRPDVGTAVDTAARELGATPMPSQTYLANAIESRGRLVPYSMIVALDAPPGAPWAALALLDGRPAPRLAEDEILLDAWSALDLGAAVGDAVSVSYYTFGPREELREERAEFRLKGIVAKLGLAADRTLAPAYPGIEDARDMAGWDPPFPVDLVRIRPGDEQYWDSYGPAPKAFVSLAAGRRLWSTRFGSTTGVRIGVPATAAGVGSFEAALLPKLLDALALESFGLRFSPVREAGLRAAVGATDFSGLFVGFSSFLIASSALVVGLLFRLGVEQRAGEIGLLLAVGHPLASVRRRLLGEGAVLAAAGGVLGVSMGIGYAALLMAGLRSVWQPAVGSSRLTLHVQPASLAFGLLAAAAVVLASVYVSVGTLARLPLASLLARAIRPRSRGKWRSVAPVLAFSGLAGALSLVGVMVATGRRESAALAFAAGALLLVSGLASFSFWCHLARHRSLRSGRAAVLALAARNSAWSPGRSVLSVALVACASFVIAVVAASREDPGRDALSRESGTGGWALVAESAVPLYGDLNERTVREELGFSPAEEAELDGVEIVPFRLRPGDDTSCLNLYRPQEPRLLGVRPEFTRRGGFRFEATTDASLAPNPWVALERPLAPGVIPAFGDANSVRWILHLAPGSELAIADELGRPLGLRIAGLLRRSLFQGELLISEKDFLEHFPSRTGFSFFLIDAPPARRDRVLQILEGRLARFGFDATSTIEKIRAYSAVEDTYLSTFQLLGALGLVLGTVGLGVVLVRNVLERRGELATLRAFGFRRSKLASMVAAENAFLLVVGIAIGGAAALAAVAPRLAVIEVPWVSLAATLAAVFATGMLASAVAVRGALAAPLLPALKADR